jgi:hypothetical protein
MKCYNCDREFTKGRHKDSADQCYDCWSHETDSVFGKVEGFKFSPWQIFWLSYMIFLIILQLICK